MSTFDTFDPNQIQKGAPVWATFVEYRNPQFKTYASRGPALSSFQPGSILYKMGLDGLWHEVWRTPRHNSSTDPALTCDFCGITSDQYLDERERLTGQKPYSRWSALKFKWVDKATQSPRYVPFCPNCAGHVK